MTESERSTKYPFPDRKGLKLSKQIKCKIRTARGNVPHFLFVECIVGSSSAHSAEVQSPACLLNAKRNLHYKECWGNTCSRRDTLRRIHLGRVDGIHTMHRKSLKEQYTFETKWTSTTFFLSRRKFGKSGNPRLRGLVYYLRT